MSFVDSSQSSLIANVIILFLSVLYSLRIPKIYKKEANQYIAILYILYVGFAYITSLSFLGGHEFYVSDAADYIASFSKSTDYVPDYNTLLLYYSQFEGKDALYKEILRCVCGYANVHLGGATVYYMTLVQTLFGLLCAVVLLQIMSRIYGRSGLKQAFLFSSCSLFLLYSSLIIRDIIIAYCFIEAIGILLDKFKLKNIFILLILCLIAMGIRMLSGAFLFSFLFLYVFLYFKKTNNKFLIVLFTLLGIIAISAFVSTVFFEDSMSEIEQRGEHMSERVSESGGLMNTLLGLPMGIRQIAIMLFSQMAPFPSYGTLLRAETFSQFLWGVDVFVYEIFWYIVFYTLLFFIIFKRAFSTFSMSEKYLFILAMFFILVLTSHPDIRRMMPVYPILYILYVKIKREKPNKEIYNVRSYLMWGYAFLLVVYVSIKGF